MDVVLLSTNLVAIDSGAPVLFGPGSIHVAHTEHERIDLCELRGAVDSSSGMVRSLFTVEAE